MKKPKIRLQEIAIIQSPIIAGKNRPECQLCGLWKTAKTPFMKVRVPNGWTKRLLLVGEAPGEHEDSESGEAFTGPVGRIIRKLLAKVGLTRSDVVFVNSVRCRPPRNRKPTMKEIRCCRPLLLRTIHKLNPIKLLFAGATALRSATNDGGKSNVGKARGRSIPMVGTDLVGFVTYHPASILRGAVGNTDRIIEDLQRDTLQKLMWPSVENEYQKDIKYIAVDTEYAPDGSLLTVGIANKHAATAHDIGPNQTS